MVGDLLVCGLVALLTLPNTHRVLPHFQLVHLDVEFSPFVIAPCRCYIARQAKMPPSFTTKLRPQAPSTATF